MERKQLKQKLSEILHTKLSEEIEDQQVELPDAFSDLEDHLSKKESMFPLAGFPRLTEMLGGGLTTRGFTILTGPTGAGKSTLCSNLWFSLQASGKNVYMSPIEIGYVEQMKSLVSIISGRPRRELTPEMMPEIREKYYPTFFSNRGHVFSKHESRVNHMDLLTELYHNFLTRNTDVAIIDNWNFMLEPAKGQDAISMNDTALHDCIVFTKKIPVHIIMVMHPRKTDGDDDYIKSIYDIKGSSTSIQESTNVLLFNRLETPDEDTPMNVEAKMCREIKCAKARFNGRAVGRKVFFEIDKNSEHYTEYRSK